MQQRPGRLLQPRQRPCCWGPVGLGDAAPRSSLVRSSRRDTPESETAKNSLTGQLAGPGPDSTSTIGAGATAPTRRLLVDQAAKLRPLPKEVTGGAWELSFPDGATELFVDPGDIVAGIRDWVSHAFEAAADTHSPTSAPVLVITGLVKTGKSYCQDTVVPSLVAEAVRNQGADGPMAGMVLLRLNAGQLNGKANEVQRIFLPTLGGELDKPGSEYIRDCFMKYLLVHGPRTMLWCITGSSMSQTWISIAEMPPNGFTLITSAYTIDLLGTSSPDHLSLVMKDLREDLLPQEVDPLLLELCPPSVALLTFLVNEWVRVGAPEDVKGFVTTKLIEESMKEWSLGLAAMPLAQRLAVLDLASVEVWSRIDNVALHAGLRRFLMPHMEKTANGRWYLRDPHQRQVLRLLIDEDGTLRDSWSEEEFRLSLMHQDSGWTLQRLGETADYLLGRKAGDRWKGKELPDGASEFREELQALADDVAEKLVRTPASKLAAAAAGRALGPQELWVVQPWFQHALQSKWNSRDLTWYSTESNGQKMDSHLAMLVFYLRLGRNMLAHMKPWDAKSKILMEVSVIEALPSVLDKPMVSFYGDAYRALRMLVSGTASDAKAVAVAEDKAKD
ncbi:hypothetical protein GPECTOR_112g266 [Gonium pectorale]|uniref:Uncharacterized protein n=1 Tax=Gonium pectorale TaxID=33097 RepID=A0A150FZ50_GONPE|nr:hypothetical protein GPECTOR_112g266 [Gonium pectorale]|eukprot:KXZ42896.1 hypothetical protein GPECTOR_112g266 [Gonium pectorale]